MTRLCSENKVPVKPGQVLVAQVLTVLMLLVLNFMVKGYLERNHSAAIHFLFGEKWSLLEELKEPADVIVLGDSSGAFCIDTDYLSEKTGQKSLNLATVGHATCINDIWMLRAYLEKFKAPKVVFLVKHISLWAWPNPDASTLASSPLPYGFWETMSPAIGMPWNEKLRFLTTRYNVLYSRRATLQGFLRPWLRSWTLARLTPAGYPVMEGGSQEVGENKEMGDLLEKGRPFEISEMNKQSVAVLESICRQNGITLVLVNGPVYEPTFQHPNFPSYLGQARDTLNKYSTSENGVLTIFPEPMRFSADQGYDPVHLRPEPAKRYTDGVLRSLSEVVKARQ